MSWAEPQSDKDASPAAYYRVEILPCDAAGKVASDAVPLSEGGRLPAQLPLWPTKHGRGNFVVRVTPYNTNDDPTRVDNSRTSAVQTFMHALPTGVSSGWSNARTAALTGISARRRMKNREFKYEVVAVLKNYTRIPTDEAWTVKLTDGEALCHVFQQTGWQAVHPPDPKFGTHFDAYGAFPGQQQRYKYLRSAQYKSETYLRPVARQSVAPAARTRTVCRLAR